MRCFLSSRLRNMCLPITRYAALIVSLTCRTFDHFWHRRIARTVVFRLTLNCDDPDAVFGLIPRHSIRARPLRSGACESGVRMALPARPDGRGVGPFDLLEEPAWAFPESGLFRHLFETALRPFTSLVLLALSVFDFRCVSLAGDIQSLRQGYCVD